MPGAVLLAFAIIFEVLGTTCMKLSSGFSELLPSIGIFISYAISFASLSLCLKKMDISLAYAIWAGLGSVLITLVGIVLFQEAISAFKLACLGLVIIGVIGINLSSD